MLFKKILYIVFLVGFLAYGVSVDKPKGYVFENLKLLEDLVRKKKSAKPTLPLSILFDEHVIDTKELLESLREQDFNTQQDVKKEDVVKQIAYHMAVLQKILALMNSNQSEPLRVYCPYGKGDALWGTLCGERPATKRIFRLDDEILKNNGSYFESSKPVRIQYIDINDESTSLLENRFPR